MGWTDERVEMLKKLWQDGLSASQIAKQLGGVTRNAVIGKVHRLGCPAVPHPPSPPALCSRLRVRHVPPLSPPLRAALPNLWPQLRPQPQPQPPTCPPSSPRPRRRGSWMRPRARLRSSPSVPICASGRSVTRPATTSHSAAAVRPTVLTAWTTPASPISRPRPRSAPAPRNWPAPCAATSDRQIPVKTGRSMIGFVRPGR